MSVDDDIGITLFGKLVFHLQRGIVIEGDEIAGSLAYIDDYAGFSSDPEHQEGHFLALRVRGGSADTGIVVELTGDADPQDMRCVYDVSIADETGEPILDTDGEAIDGMRLGETIMVFRLTDKGSQTIRVVASRDGLEPMTREYSLDGLVLEEKP